MMPREKPALHSSDGEQAPDPASSARGAEAVASASGGTVDDGPGPLWVEGRTTAPGRRLTARVKDSGCHQVKELEPSAAVFHVRQGIQESHLV